MLKVDNITLPMDYTEDDLTRAVCERLRIKENEIEELTVDKRELVKGKELYFKTTVLCKAESNLEKKSALILRKKSVSLFTEEEYSVKASAFKKRPVIAGFGPAGIFAALVLAESGARPIVLERGQDTKTRIKQVEEFSNGGFLNSESNIQFGEGGAGAFSDGKLKVGYKDSRKRKILREFVEAGASDTILYFEKPHVGSDVLHKVIVNLRKKIISLGGEVRFGARLCEIISENGCVTGAVYEKDGEKTKVDTDCIILATGHSARDTYEYLFAEGVKMESKGFGVGVRIEHPQQLINAVEYGDGRLSEKLGAADYKMVVHLDNGRSLYTFCMCPGGYVVPAASEKGGICTNGMSEFARDSGNANTALLVSVTPNDFDSDHPLAGIEYQRRIERMAFDKAGGNYYAPIIRLKDFMEHRESTGAGCVAPSYLPGTVALSPDEYMPDYVCDTLRKGIAEMCDWKNGYGFDDALLTGPETRTTSPVKILRSESFEASLAGLFPAGEGAGYAGGIISSAVDGMMIAEAVIERNNLKNES